MTCADADQGGKCDYYCPTDFEELGVEEYRRNVYEDVMGDWFEYSMEYDGSEAYSDTETFLSGRRRC